MGRKSKVPVKIDSSGGGTDVPPQDGLPAFLRYIDIKGKEYGLEILTRVFFVLPTEKEVAETVQRHQSEEDHLYVIGAGMPYMPSGKCTMPLFEECKSLGLCEEISHDIVRMAIVQLQGKYLGQGSVSTVVKSMQKFVEFLASRSEKPQKLTDINKEDWADYLERCVADNRPITEMYFNAARLIFSSYQQTSLGGWLDGLMFKRGKRGNLSKEHTSEVAEAKDYSDVVMYQLLSLFIFTFEQRIGFLKRYEKITEADMPEDWIYPGRKAKIKKKGTESDTSQLLLKWLTDGDTGYETLINHYILHHKAGAMGHRLKGDKRLNISEKLISFYSRDKNKKTLVSKFHESMGRRHGYDSNGSLNLLFFYVNDKKVPTEPNYIINQIGWCLANLIMMQTGVNKEVVLTIPSKSENGESILTRGDTVFVRKDDMESEINLYGTKARTGGAPEKIIPIIIVKNSPLYEMLIDYERYVKVGDGPFFEFNRTFVNQWSSGGSSANGISNYFKVTNEAGEILTTIDSTRFRKVFASGQLLDRMKNVKDMSELAEKLRDDLNHGNLDTTLTNYLLKSTVGRSIIDIAIATISGEKLNDLKCKSQIQLSEPIKFKKKVFLCHCVDPHNPSHDVAIADECRHYDLCLGCEQSTIAKEHLPYICLRILQYEAEREKDPYIWTATFEDRWCIAHDALECYINADKRNGRRFIDDAWITAREGRISLPPIISPTRV